MHQASRSENGPRVSLIIPSLDGHRDGAVPKLLDSIGRQTFRDFETHLVKGVSPQGKAINQGARQARGEILVILDDDSCLADETVLERLVAAIDEDDRIGMAGASIVLPPNATPFQCRAAAQFPRFNTPVVDTVTDSDFACHGCCAIPAALFWEVGGECEDVLRGLDPDLRVRLRAARYRVVLVPHARIHHPLPDGWRRLLRTFFRNGFGSAHTRKFHPELAYETDEKLEGSNFQPRRSLAYRAIRFPLRLLGALVQGRFLRSGAYCAYACGYVWGTITAREQLH